MTDTSREIALIAYVQQEVWRRFIYVPDSKTHPEAPDFWESHYAKLEADPKYTVRDDCDGLAATVVDGILAHGWPLHRAMLAMVGSGGGKKIDHLIGLVELIDGKIYVVGDTFSRQVYPIGRCKHRIIKYVRLDHRGKVMDWMGREKRAVTEARQSRGARNFNPGNIRIGDPWQGLMPREDMTPEQAAEKEFCVFKSPKWGIRALCRVLIAYKDKYQLDTVTKIITRWAPPGENDTAAYVWSVCEQTGFGATEVIDVYDPDTMRALVKAIITHENGGNPYSDAVIEEGMKAAGVDIQPHHPSKTRVMKAGMVGSASTGAAAVTDTIQQFQQPLSDLALYLDIAKYVLLFVTLASFGFAMWSLYSQYKKQVRA